MRRLRSGLLALSLGLAGAGLLAAGLSSRAGEEKMPMDSQLAPLGRLVGGFWHLEGGKPLNGYNSFTWGPNRRTIHGTFYIVGDGKAEDPIRADGLLYWHPGRKKICGTTVGAGGEVYDGEMTLDPNGWTQDFQHHTDAGSTAFRETWVFPDADTYVWTLYRKTDDGLKQMVQATFRRLKERPRAE